VKSKRIPMWITAPLIVGAFGLLLLGEIRRPLRRKVESKFTRNVRNFVVAAISASMIQATERPLINPLTALVERRRLGLLQRMPIPKWIEVPLAVALMDYTLYIWHILTHKVSFLWRFHLVHHIDLDLDASTALRFHFAELLISIPWRAAQVTLIGIGPLPFSLWQTALSLWIMFHHSNVELPIDVERWLSRFIVTPRLHGIHHSIMRRETNSNWSSGLTIWDWLHGTLNLNVPQQEITIGVPAYREPEEVTLPKILKMPFGKERQAWQLPGDGEPIREPLPVATNELLP
jgi:sterol desaturase/sphingolipid hydroxylase (fatty acid hydroxylase superfamily)